MEFVTPERTWPPFQAPRWVRHPAPGG